MQATIVTNRPEKVIAMIHTKLHRGVTQINNAEGTYNHEKKRFCWLSLLVKNITTLGI